MSAEDAIPFAIAEPAPAAPKKPVPRPLLISNSLIVEVVCEPPDGSPFGPFTIRVKPFTRNQAAEYFESLRAFADADGKIVKPAEYRAAQVKAIAPRITKWDAEIVPDTVAEINQGTVEGLPGFAIEQAFDALCGAAGTIVGNS